MVMRNCRFAAEILKFYQAVVLVDFNNTRSDFGQALRQAQNSAYRRNTKHSVFLQGVFILSTLIILLLRCVWKWFKLKITIDINTLHFLSEAGRCCGKVHPSPLAT